jgi:signal peptidase II
VAVSEQQELERPTGPRGAALVALAVTVLVVLGIDLLTKQLALSGLADGHAEKLLGGLVWLDLTRNSGAAFSIGSGFTMIFPLIAIVVMVAILFLARRLRSTPWALSLGLILGGALGNFVDRLFRAPGPLQGHVVDFISVFAPAGQKFPIFNAADSALFCGVVLAILLEFTGRRRDGTRVKPQATPDPATTGAAAGVRDSHRDEA